MPKRNDIKSIMIIGAGPIVIGQACEFDYSGAQACKALREEGYRVILVNSNPATIMTDRSMADSIYIEPIEWQVLESIIKREKPDALLPTMGGQTALNCALDLHAKGVLAKYNVELIGATPEAIEKAEDRDKFREAMTKIGLDMPKNTVVHNMEEALAAVPELGFPIICRPSFTLGGSGGGIAYDMDEFKEIIERGLYLSPTNEVLLDESILGWKEYEMEVVRDKNDNAIIVCSIENFDPMGIHTGDSITVAPAQTLTDREYQIMRNASLAVLREIGVETGGSNVQFAVDPETGRMIIIEMNPRVSRSSALASKATGFPIAKVAAKLAVGYTLDELANDITGGATPASFEPTIDYVVTKIPRFTFEKFPQAESYLTTQMKSVGEVMAIGRDFKESMQKALRGLETGATGFDPIDFEGVEDIDAAIHRALVRPGDKRPWYIAEAIRRGWSMERLFEATKIDPWFMDQLFEIIEAEQAIEGKSLADLDVDQLRLMKQMGFSDARIATLLNVAEDDVRAHRRTLSVLPVYKRVDTCAAEFATETAYLYSTYDEECEAAPSDAKKIIVLGGGPNRIGQGIEFDYCCVHASQALAEAGYETIMVNCNPETVSTDYDTSDRLYFEPLTLEDVLEIVRVEQPHGVIVQYGGQTPLKLARALEAEGVPIIGTSPDSIDWAEDRERFQALVEELGLLQPPNRLARAADQAVALAEEIGYPLVVRPSYVLGGRAMEIVHDENDLQRYMREAVKVSNDSPVLLDRFLDDAIEVDVDCICDGQDVYIGGIMEHIEQAGVHSGDSACSLPPYNLPLATQDRIIEQVRELALALNVRGLMNTQFAVKGDEIFLLEVNPRASRTAPFVSKATGVPLAKLGALVMSGKTLKELGVSDAPVLRYYNVKESVFPFAKFPGVDPLLGPEMKSTGEVMGVGRTFGEAFLKGALATGVRLPHSGTVLISVRDADKPAAVRLAQKFVQRGFKVVATGGTYDAIRAANVECERVNKIREGSPHIVDRIIAGDFDLIINTTEGKQAIADSYAIRREALNHQVPYTTTVSAGNACLLAIQSEADFEVYKLQDLHEVAE